MNQHDRDNLQFLLTADSECMQNWYASVSQDDIEYAQELLRMAGTELEVKEMEFADAHNNLDITQAQSVLARFRLQ